MSKPSFSLMAVFWLMLAVCGFLGGRASMTNTIRAFEARALNSEFMLESRSRSFDAESQRSADTFNAFGEFLKIMDGLGPVDVLTGRALRVIDGTAFEFEEYDDSGTTISRRTVQLDAINAPMASDPVAKTCKTRLRQMLIEDHESPWVVLIVPQAEATSNPLKAFVVTNSADRGYAYVFAQFELLRAGLATVDETHPILTKLNSLKSAEHAARTNQVGIWASNQSKEDDQN